MARDLMNYPTLMDAALRGVIRTVLARTAEHGLPGAHHFYLSFRSDHPGVEVPDYLRERYPDEITIVLQHQFWGLEVGEERFQVSLSFNDRQERLVVPFAAITGFADPSVSFGLQFEAKAGPGAAAPDGARPVALAPARPAQPGPARPDDSVAGGEAGEPARKGEVVALDTFRKK